MAASEGQLAVEFVQALTAEARAHREYLQLLYTLTLGVVGGGMLLVLAAIVWLVNRALNRARQEVASEFSAKLSGLLEEQEESMEAQVASLRDKLSEHEREARNRLDEIVRFASKAKRASDAEEVDERDLPKYEAIVISDTTEPKATPHYVMLQLDFGLGFESPDHIERDRLAHYYSMNGPIFFIDADEFGVEESLRIYRILRSFIPDEDLVLFTEQTTGLDPRLQSVQITSGLSDFVARLSRYAQKNRR